MWQRIGVSVAALLVMTSAAIAQRQPPTEKLSPHPVKTAPLPPQVTGTALFTYSPWVKVCGRDKNDPSAARICLTMMEVRRTRGPFAAGAALIEGAGEKKVLRVTLPADVRQAAGARIFVDGGAPRNAAFSTCNLHGCLADFEASDAFIAKLKGSSALHLRGTYGSGQVASFRLPLGDFAKANEGLPGEPRPLEMWQ
jgi:invasion protein IalB